MKLSGELKKLEINGCKELLKKDVRYIIRRLKEAAMKEGKAYINIGDDEVVHSFDRIRTELQNMDENIIVDKFRGGSDFNPSYYAEIYIKESINIFDDLGRIIS